MVVSDLKRNTITRIDFPRISGTFSGCGDLCSALVTAWLYRHRNNISLALENVVSTMSSVLTTTSLRKSQELCIIESRNNFIAPSVPLFSAFVMRGPVEGVIFDMDGTLTEAGAIDFQAMYDRIGLSKRNGVDILTQIQQDLSEDKHELAHAIIIDEEIKGCESTVVQSDLNHTISFFRKHRVRTAISTRNCALAYDKFVEKASVDTSHFHPVLTRESLGGVNKPDPRVAMHILKEWDISDAGHVWFVGDSIDDMKCGRGAGCKTCFIWTAENQHHIENKEDVFADIIVQSLTEFVEHIRPHLE